MDKNNGAIYDARKLGKPKMIILGVQHMFAMFGATILVPILTGLDISTTLLMAGLGTLLFHCITKFKVPAFLGSSFAFLGGYAAIKAFSPNDPNSMLPYACLGVACAGLIYFILAAVIKAVGIEKVMRFFPPVVTGPYYHSNRSWTCSVGCFKLHNKLVLGCSCSCSNCCFQHLGQGNG